MYLQELQAVLDGVDLIDDYHNKTAIKELVKTRFVYKDNVKPVTAYINSLLKFSPVFYNRWVTYVTQGKEMGPRRFWTATFKEGFQTRLDQFLEECYANQPELKSVLNSAITSYTSTNRFSPEQLAYLRRLQSLPPQSQRSEIVTYIKKEQFNAKKRAAEAKKRDLALPKLTPEELEAQRKIPVPEAVKTAAIQAEQQRVQHLENLGEPLPLTAHTQSDMGVIRNTAETQTAGQANMPVSNIRQGFQNLTSRALGERQILKPFTGEALSQGKVAFTRFQPVKRAGDLGGGFIRQIPFLSGARGGGSAGLISRGGASITRGVLGLASKGVGRAGARALLASPAGVLFCLILALAVLPILLSMFNINDNAALCPPWLGCPKSAGAEPLAPSQNLLIVKEGPVGGKVPNDSPIAYTITVSYKGLGTAKVDLTDKIPENTHFVSASPNETGVFERQNQGTPQETLIWHLTDLKTNAAKSVTFTVHPNSDKRDFWAVNQAAASATITEGGGTGQGLLCAADVDPRLIPMFEQSGVAANVSPALMYAVAKGEHGGGPINALSLDGKTSINELCGAHGIMQILHPNDGRPGSPGRYSACTSSGPPSDSWNSILQYNPQTGGKLNNVDNDEDNIWGSAFFLRYNKINNYPFKDKGYQDRYEDSEIVRVSIGYLGEFDPEYANLYLKAYHEVIAAQGTCGGTSNSGNLTP